MAQAPTEVGLGVASPGPPAVQIPGEDAERIPTLSNYIRSKLERQEVSWMSEEKGGMAQINDET